MISLKQAIILSVALLVVHMHATAEEPNISSPPSPSTNEPSLQDKAVNGKADSIIDGDHRNSIVEEVKVIERPYYHGSGLFALGGALGGLIASSAWKDEPDRIAGFVKQEKIDIGKIVKSEFERQFEQSTASKQVLEKMGSAKFKMIILYGITSVPFSDYRPFLSVRMNLIDANGTEKWKDREYVGGHGNAKSIPYPDFFKSANDFTSEFGIAANEVVSLLMKDFAK